MLAKRRVNLHHLGYRDGGTTQMIKRSVLAVALVFAIGFIGMPAASAQDADDPAAVEEGREIYANSCSGCHGDDGTGSASGRPLTDIASQESDRNVHITSVTEGKGGMPPFGSKLSEEEIDAVISFVRLEFVEAEAESADEPADDEADEDDDARADNATADDAPAALAETGVESFQLVTIGVALILAGAMFLSVTRRDDLVVADEV